MDFLHGGAFWDNRRQSLSCTEMRLKLRRGFWQFLVSVDGGEGGGGGRERGQAERGEQPEAGLERE